MKNYTSFIADNLILHGNFEIDGDLRVDGIVSGYMYCKGSLTIGQTAHIDGTVSAHSINSDGKIYGTIKAKKIYLSKSSSLIGSIQASELELEKESSFEGDIEIS